MIRATNMTDVPIPQEQLQDALAIFEAPTDGTAGLTVVLTDDHRYRGRALAVPGAYYSRERKAYAIDNPNARAASAAIALFPEVLIAHPELQAIREAGYGDARPYDYASEVNIKMGVGKLGDLTLYNWQDTDGGYLHAILERDGGSFPAWDRGLGKTVITAAFIKRMGARRTLVAARNDAKEVVWEAQLKELLPDHQIAVLPDSTQGSKQKKMLTLLEKYAFEGETEAAPLVLIIHYQAIRTIAGDKVVEHKDGTKTVTKGGGDGWDRLGDWDLFAYDESHRLASYNPNSRKNTQEGRALSQLRRKHIKHVINLSGSAVMNKPDDLFGQLHLLYPHIYRAKWADWNDRFVDYVMDGNRKIPIGWRLDKMDELRRELGVFMVYRNKRDPDINLELPPLIEKPIELEMLPDQRRVYNQVRDEFWAQVQDAPGIVAVNAMDQMNKLRQIATAWPGVGSVKLDYAMSELEEEPDAQFVIFTWYKRPGHLLAERLGDSAVVVDGDVPGRERAVRLRDHKAGRYRVLIGSIATLGESLNLQYVHEAIRLDRHWNPEVNGQTKDRLDRQGQQERVTFTDLWTKHTVDMLRVWPTLRSKESLGKALFS